ncbi:hypothetical protein BDR07DRAFT_1375539 [Suillus spraguei]|nr:hypothetical protein BDR07DRAFT_1375539 [Suillus spraguei]
MHMINQTRTKEMICRDCHSTELYWNGSFFEKTSLKSLGLCIQLGHHIGIQCNNPIPASNDNFVVIDVNGDYAIGLNFCGCKIAQPHAFTFPRAIILKVLLPCNLVHVWCCVQLAPIQEKTCLVAINANFKLARHNVLSDTVDLGLNHGYAFFCRRDSIQVFPQFMRTHNSRATGAGTIDCARHNFKQPNSVSDLQQDERYINMDYMCFSSMLLASTLQVINISYDITCQWSKNLWTHMSAFPQQYHLGTTPKLSTFWFQSKTIVHKLQAAFPEHLECTCDLYEFEPAFDPTQLAYWKHDIKAWEFNHSKPNPFELKVTSGVLSLKAIKSDNTPQILSRQLSYNASIPSVDALIRGRMYNYSICHACHDCVHPMTSLLN